METKAFKNWAGKDKHLTREQFIEQWLDETARFWLVFDTEEEFQNLIKFRESLARVAGKKWDESK
jgi:hypothetical protein